MILDVLDLCGSLRQLGELLVGELILGSFDGLEQEVAVVVTVLDHRHALVGGEEEFFPQLGVLGQDGSFLRPQPGVQGLCLLLGLGHAVAAVLVPCGLGAAGCHAAHQHKGEEQRDNFLYVHFDSSVFSSLTVSFVVCLPLPKP